MKWLDKILNFFRRKNKTKMLDKAKEDNTNSIVNKQLADYQKVQKNENGFKESLKISETKNNNKTEVETDIIIGNGLGISDKLDY